MHIFSIILTIVYVTFTHFYAKKETLLTGQDLKKDGCMISFYNSTSVIGHISLSGKSGEHALMINENAHLSVEYCKIVLDGQSNIPFICSGYILMKGIELTEKENGDVSVPTLCLNNENNGKRYGHFVLSDCKFQGCVMLSHEGTFVSSGEGEEQIVKNCEFLNFSIKKGGEESKEVKRCEVMNCYISNVKMENGPDSFYGVILSGVTRKNLHEFDCTNGTFININRKTLQNYGSKDKNNKDKDMKELPKDKMNFKQRKQRNSVFGRFSEDNRARIELVDYYRSFSRTSFRGCKAVDRDGDSYGKRGGGILITVDIGDVDSIVLYVSQCSFTKCEALRSGGGLYIYGGTCNYYHCEFESCKTIGYGTDEGSGGGAYISISERGNVYESLFTKCSAPIGGGLSFDSGYGVSVQDDTYNIIYGCKFQDCSAGSNDDKVYDIYTGGGGDIYLYSHQQMSECIFKKCKSQHLGGGVHLYKSPLENNTINLCYFENNEAEIGGICVYLNGTFYDNVIPISEDTHVNKDDKDNCWFLQSDKFYSINLIAEGSNKVPKHKAGVTALYWWALLLVIFAVIVFIIAVVIVVCIIVRRRKNKKNASSEENPTEVVAEKA